MAASDLWIKRLVDVSENLKSIKHFIGISKLYDTGDDALPRFNYGRISTSN